MTARSSGFSAVFKRVPVTPDFTLNLDPATLH